MPRLETLTRRSLLSGGIGLGISAALVGAESSKTWVQKRVLGNKTEEYSYKGTPIPKDSPLVREARQKFKSLASQNSAVNNEDMYNAIADFFDNSGSEDELQIHLDKHSTISLGHHRISPDYDYALVDFMDNQTESMFFGFKKFEDGSIQPFDSDFELDPEEGDFPINLDQKALRAIANAISNGITEAREIESL